MTIQFGREICGDLEQAQQREWLVTNGIGGYGCGTVAGLLTRQYHGVLVAAMEPPCCRRLRVVKLDETIQLGGKSYPLYTNRWADGTVAPRGYYYLEQFRLVGRTPVWIYACGEARLEKSLWMEWGHNTTYVRYRLLRGGRSLELSIKALVNDRSHHGGITGENWDIDPCPQGVKLSCEGGVPCYILGDRGLVTPRYNWYAGFDLARERDRGSGDYEDHLHGATLKATLDPGDSDSFTVAVTTEALPTLNAAAAWRRHQAREQELVATWQGSSETAAPNWIQQLVLAADSFVVTRHPLYINPEQPETTLLTGYPWFGDWGRYTMMSLPGLTLATGRPEVMRSVLTSAASYFQDGVLPNVFPDDGGLPAYNTVDASLWYIEAVRLYVKVTGDRPFLEQIYPTLVDVVEAYSRGVSPGIHLDRQDGLLESQAQLTWMDAKVGETPITPRQGKAVEVNALWYNAILTMTQFAEQLGQRSKPYHALGRQIQAGFQRFWNPSLGYCYDVLDGPNGDDMTLRPNQLLAAYLPGPLLSSDRCRTLLDICSRSLLTSYGLRSLCPDDVNYLGHYGGNLPQRDRAYHQGTTWAWWLGIYSLAHYRLYGDASAALSFLSPIADHLQTAGLGQISEIFDGDDPLPPRGCIAHGAAVASVLWAWRAIAQSKATSLADR
ncbi:amylo-alpha-1,6-glucosidase [Phormidium yuhuli AB48]|uniref:Amylo-alpha-1,6-glucosidase n=1 Tax=Phormidium yuhuli AB48 TaxID=2940671 RepID=A0ABY5ASK6_9CYAN|nr:amylo-alpha-1,6-glucosidase [Phormidium yuhuli]USR91838.1 amylo-alpha-1,6-glucosidase [Phormidium yuhuli AB48]